MAGAVILRSPSPSCIAADEGSTGAACQGQNMRGAGVVMPADEQIGAAAKKPGHFFIASNKILWGRAQDKKSARI